MKTVYVETSIQIEGERDFRKVMDYADMHPTERFCHTPFEFEDFDVHIVSEYPINEWDEYRKYVDSDKVCNPYNGWEVIREVFCWLCCKNGRCLFIS